MITFKRFLKEGVESAPLPKTKEDTEKALLDFQDCIDGGIDNCQIVDTAFGPAVNVNGNVNLKSLSLEYLPVRFHNVKGNFQCSMNKELKSVEGAPKWVEGFVSFDHCWSLTNLDYLANIKFQCEGVASFSHCKNLERISQHGKMLSAGGYTFSDCEVLTTLEGIGTIFRNLNIVGTAITSFHNFHKQVEFTANSTHYGHRTGDLILYNGIKHQVIEDSSLNLMMVKGIKAITYSDKLAPWFDIIENGITGKIDILEIQSRLIDAGYIKQAKI